jgi:hypothetical protein
MRIVIERIGNGWLVEAISGGGDVARFFTRDPMDGAKRAHEALVEHANSPEPGSILAVRFPRYAINQD